MNRDIGKTTVGKYWVSTVLLRGCDEFETMVFEPGSDRPWRELDVKRYLTREDAIKGHNETVKEWEKK